MRYCLAPYFVDSSFVSRFWLVSVCLSLSLDPPFSSHFLDFPCLSSSPLHWVQLLAHCASSSLSRTRLRVFDSMSHPAQWGHPRIEANETTSLVPKASQTNDGRPDVENGAASPPEGDSSPPWRLVVKEFLLLLRSSVPVILAYTLQMSLQTISVVIVGRGSADDLATSAFAYMFAMASAWLIALGGTTALDTLASASFTGSKNPHDLGILLQRGFLILGLFYVPVALLWFFSEPVFLALGQDAQISRDSARFLRVLIPGGLGYIYFETMKKYLQAQGTNISTNAKCSKLNISRDHETRNLCPFACFAAQRSTQLSLHLYTWHRSSWRTDRNRLLILAGLLTISSVLSLR